MMTINNKMIIVLIIMLVNRLLGCSPVLSYGFATKSLKQIKLRMKAVESIRKITKAMKMVAASKMKQDVGRLERSKKFGMGTVQKVLENESYAQKKRVPATGKIMLVPITTDKGLCGGVNSSIIRQIKAMVKADRPAYKLFVVGDKGSAALSRPMPDLMEFAITNVLTPLSFVNAASIAYQVQLKAEDCSKIILVYNEFKNVISQIQRKVQIINRNEFAKTFSRLVKHESSMDENGKIFYDFYIASTFYTAMLNNIASEQSSRMNAMENASKNAAEIVEKLTLEYNKARQAKITMELCEIISGAAAV